jgi:hypothetical protein
MYNINRKEVNKVGLDIKEIAATILLIPGCWFTIEQALKVRVERKLLEQELRKSQPLNESGKGG